MKKLTQLTLALIVMLRFSNQVVLAQSPTFESITLSPTTLVNGGTITVTVRAKLPPTTTKYLYIKYKKTPYNPQTEMQNSFWGASKSADANGIWEAKFSKTYSKWEPGGVFTYSDIALSSNGMDTLDSWPGVLTYALKSNYIAYKPVVQATSVVTAMGINSFSASATIKSNVPLIGFGCYIAGVTDESNPESSTVKEIAPETWQGTYQTATTTAYPGIYECGLMAYTEIASTSDPYTVTLKVDKFTFLPVILR